MAVRKATKASATRKTPRYRKKEQELPRQKLCCCPPRAMVWIESRTSCCFIENQIDMKRRLQVRADAAASVQPPGGPAVNAEGAGGSQLDEGTYKDQGKVYRTDSYTIHWKAEGLCRPLGVVLIVGGEIDYTADCLPEEGEITISRTYMLEPPDYSPPGPGMLTAILEVVDCANMSARCKNEGPRP